MADTVRVDVCYRPLRIGWAVREGDRDRYDRLCDFHMRCGAAVFLSSARKKRVNW
jgi:hypothetical protein